MDILVFVGMICLFIVLALSVPDIFINPAVYLQFASAMMVIGGTISLFIMASSFEDVKGVLAGIKTLVKKEKFPSHPEIVDKLVELSILSQKEGRLALEEAGQGFDDGFLGNSLLMIVNKLHPDFIRVVLENEIQEIDARHMNNVGSITFMSSIAPLTGMFGTIVGILQVLQNMTDPKTVGPSMALALLTTLYGVFISGFILQPIGKRLEKKNEHELLSKTIMVEGIIMIAKGEIPIKVETYLRGFLSNKVKKEKKQESETKE
ncbi:MAG: MotA/TolQ/ExbB proton channel family protein [Candidatus Margulisbacteria bacterium]|nr:MotA/TolQ/ExbB proton channel family protein [Candidatus Margulisiibacteriota bacterium]